MINCTIWVMLMADSHWNTQWIRSPSVTFILNGCRRWFIFLTAGCEERPQANWALVMNDEMEGKSVAQIVDENLPWDLPWCGYPNRFKFSLTHTIQSQTHRKPITGCVIENLKCKIKKIIHIVAPHSNQFRNSSYHSWNVNAVILLESTVLSQNQWSLGHP